MFTGDVVSRKGNFPQEPEAVLSRSYGRNQKQEEAGNNAGPYPYSAGFPCTPLQI